MEKMTFKLKPYTVQTQHLKFTYLYDKHLVLTLRNFLSPCLAFGQNNETEASRSPLS